MKFLSRSRVLVDISGDIVVVDRLLSIKVDTRVDIDRVNCTDLDLSALGREVIDKLTRMEGSKDVD